MLIPNPRLARYGGLVKGAIIEPGDGTLILPPIIQPIIELTSPVTRGFSAGQAVPGGTAFFDDSFFKSDRLTQAGVGALTTIQITPTLAAGSWVLDFACSFGFTGTTALGNNSGLIMQDPDGNNIQIFEWVHITGNFGSQSSSWRFTFQRDGFFVFISRGITVAADNVYISGS